MSGVSKINGIALANVGKVNNIAKANLGKISGITVPAAATSYTSANSVFFDNTNDYGVINGCVLPTDEGSVSFWLKIGQTQAIYDLIQHLEHYTSNENGLYHDEQSLPSYYQNRS